ncbi:MAG: DNA-directed RNA polymerase subunit H [archaeon]
MVSNHFLVPKHAIMPKAEVETFLKKYAGGLEKLPRASRNDPVVLELGAKRGDVLKIIRDSRTAGKCVYYRVVG